MGFLDEVIDPPKRELDDLRREVRALRRTIATLAQLLYEADAFANISQQTVQRRLSAAARIDDQDDEEETGGVVASAYRGAVPGEGALACAMCKKPLAEDDPVLSVRRRGRVCLGCFERSRSSGG